MNMPWYPFYPGDYAADTSDLSCEEHGCYRLLLDASWSRGPLPNDLDRLQRLSASPKAETVRFILERFWKLTDPGWINAKLERVRANQVLKHDKRVIGGLLTAWKRHGDETSKKKLQDLGYPVDNSSLASSLASSSASSSATPLASSRASSRACSNQNQNQIKEKETPGAKNRRAKKPKPTVSEIAEYCAQRKNKIDAEAFFDFYESKGWLVGKNPMRDWKAAVRTWERKSKTETSETTVYGAGGI